MKLEHDFTVPAPVDEAWKVLLDVERIAPCMPGATLLTVDGDTFTGTVKVKVGPIQVTYKGNATFTSRDDDAHRAVIEASGKEARGTGTAAATVTTVLVADGPDRTKVSVETDLNVTGRPAQFGRGVMAEVSGKLIGQFATRLADELAAPSPGVEAAAPAQTSGATTPAEPVQKDTTPAEPVQKDTTPAEPVQKDPAPAEPVQTDAAPPLPPTAAAPVEAAPMSAPAVPAEPAPAPRSEPRVVRPRPEAQPIDLLDVAGASVAKRVAPVAAVLALLLLLVWRRRRG